MSIFLWIMGGSVLFFVFTWLLGLSEGGDHDVGIDLHDGGGDIHGGDIHDGDAPDHHDGPRVFSIRNFALFGMGFGATGTIATQAGCSTVEASLWGASTGVVMVWLIYMLYKMLYSQQASSISNLENIRNRPGVVSIRIPENGIGEVQTKNEYGVTVTVTAQSVSGEIPVGTKVFILSFVSGHAQVELPN